MPEEVNAVVLDKARKFLVDAGATNKKSFNVFGSWPYGEWRFLSEKYDPDVIGVISIDSYDDFVFHVKQDLPDSYQRVILASMAGEVALGLTKNLSRKISLAFTTAGTVTASQLFASLVLVGRTLSGSDVERILNDFEAGKVKEVNTLSRRNSLRPSAVVDALRLMKRENVFLKT